MSRKEISLPLQHDYDVKFATDTKWHLFNLHKYVKRFVEKQK